MTMQSTIFLGAKLLGVQNSASKGWPTSLRESPDTPIKIVARSSSFRLGPDGGRTMPRNTRNSPFSVWMLFFCTLWLSSPAHSTTFMDPCSANGVQLSSEIVIGYHDPTTPFTPVPVPPPAIGANLIHTVPPYTASVHYSTAVTGIAATPTITRAPAFTGMPAKDLVVGTVSSEFGYGTPTGPLLIDSVRLRAFGTASAVNAFDTAGGPADAVVEGRAFAEFYVDPVLPSCSGDIGLPALRPLAPYETRLEIQVLQMPAGTTSFIPIFTQMAGDPPTLVPITPNAFYRIVLDYRLRVPHSNDPPYDADITVTVMGAPAVPAMSVDRRLLLVMGLLLLGGGFLLRGRIHRNPS